MAVNFHFTGAGCSVDLLVLGCSILLSSLLVAFWLVVVGSVLVILLWWCQFFKFLGRMVL